MQIVTSWMEEGIAQGVQQGMLQGMQLGMEQGVQQGEVALVFRQLARKLGELPGSVFDAIRALSLPAVEELGDALLDFTRREDLEAWLKEHGTPEI